jgi:CBS domain-containing protein
MRVRDIMTADALVIPEGATVEYAAQKMKRHNVGLLAVGDRHNVIGVVTDRDITVRVTAESKDPKHMDVREVMTPNRVYCFDDQDVEDACFMMLDNHIRRVLVFDRCRDLVGILSLDDVAVRTRKEKLVGYALSKVAKAA